ncbi:MAG TPA: PepSY-like domain-containing protein [Candidatus Hydrogenedentes bacterium]|nr:PepSY-like domain-containing protein [Candidatus Hydrogenedentota bacterium]HQM50355.1 PepSY-like domain-containing protein [Candidatus Hydrogenedentota bacterium]
MKTGYLTGGALMVIALVAGVVAISGALAEEEVALDQLPPAARAMIQQHAEQGQIVEIEKETEDGRVVYEAEIVVNGKETEIQVSANGELLETETEVEDKDAEDEASISWGRLPKAVQEAFTKAIPAIRIDRVTRETEDGVVVYEAEYTVEGTPREAEVLEDGQILETSERVAAAKLPAAVAAAVKEHFPGAEIEEAEAVHVTYYEIELEVQDKEQEIRVLPDGRILATEDGEH